VTPGATVAIRIMDDAKPARKGRLLGYARVSSNDAYTNLKQTEMLEAAGCQFIFEEVASGRHAQPELHRLLDQLCEGDTVVVCKVDRLSPTLRDVLHSLERIVAAGAGFLSITERINTSARGGCMAKRLFLALLGMDRGVIHERMVAGLNAARAGGSVLGRPRKLDATKEREIAESVVSGIKSAAAMARLHGVSRATISRIVDEHRTREATE
jgi:DNA invertase Pin-like site-specific DNA recombinase